MGATIEKGLPGATVTMLPGGRGDFIVIADGVRIWDKRKTGSFPEHEAILKTLRSA